ncbi:MAG: hypothetical protein J7L44_01355 [Candidatus Diapherotrites archaeon]|nr:hypothetical protein [Candidatus Diapherotrites archaeon]
MKENRYLEWDSQKQHQIISYLEQKTHNPKHIYKYIKSKETKRVPMEKDIDYGSEEFKNLFLI